MTNDEGQGGRAKDANRARTTGAALEAHYRFVLWLVPTVERFPRKQKFLLGERIQATALDVLERLIEATYTRQRRGRLADANGSRKTSFPFSSGARPANSGLSPLRIRGAQHRRDRAPGRRMEQGRTMPKRETDLFEGIAAFSALLPAALRAARGKRGKPGVAAFLAGLETELLRLERELQSGRYRPGRYTKIEIFDPKHIVSAAPFRDRVVHHAFCAVCEPIFERGFIHDSYANRLGKGTHRAVARYERFRDRYRHVLRCDIYRYFPAIDHEILKRDLRRRIACERTLALADRIIDGSNPQEPNLLFPGDDL